MVDKCFENNLIFIDDDYKVVISESAKKDKSLYEQLKIYEGKKIFIPKNKNAQPKKEYLKIHRENNWWISKKLNFIWSFTKGSEKTTLLILHSNLICYCGIVHNSELQIVIYGLRKNI